MTDSQSPSVDARVTAFFAKLEATWRAKDYASMRHHWVKGLLAPLYLAEEVRAFTSSWAEFDAYFANNAKVAPDGVQVSYAPMQAVPMGQSENAEPIVMATFEARWSTQLKTDDAPIGGTIRGVAVLQDDGSEYKLRAYIEAPIAPIIYVRDLYKLFAKQPDQLVAA